MEEKLLRYRAPVVCSIVCGVSHILTTVILFFFHALYMMILVSEYILYKVHLSIYFNT